MNGRARAADTSMTNPQDARRGREIGIGIVLVVVATTLTLLVGEIGFRLVERVRCRDLAFGYMVRSRLWGWGHRPGAAGWLQGCLGNRSEWRTWIRINRHGLRGDDVPYERTGAFRVLVLGDSFTAAIQVDEQETFAKRLERRLAGSLESRVEVLNAGVSAWGTDNELEFYRHEGVKYRPDLVLLAFDTSNDVFESTRGLVGTDPFFPDKPYYVHEHGHVALRHSPLPESSLARRLSAGVAGPLALHSALFRRVAAIPAVRDLLLIPPPSPLLADKPEETMGVYRADYPPIWRAAWRLDRRLLLRLRREVARQGARFAVAVINGREVLSRSRWDFAMKMRPWLQGVALDPEKPNRLVTRFLARHDIPAIPLLDAFRAQFANDATPGHFQWDTHWTPVGHELAARLIADGLRAHGLLPAAARPPAR
jgi:hypothetical protein